MEKKSKVTINYMIWNCSWCYRFSCWEIPHSSTIVCFSERASGWCMTNCFLLESTLHAKKEDLDSVLRMGTRVHLTVGDSNRVWNLWVTGSELWVQIFSRVINSERQMEAFSGWSWMIVIKKTDCPAKPDQQWPERESQSNRETSDIELALSIIFSLFPFLLFFSGVR